MQIFRPFEYLAGISQSFNNQAVAPYSLNKNLSHFVTYSQSITYNTEPIIRFLSLNLPPVKDAGTGNRQKEMDRTYLLTTLLGFLAQGFFSARILVQWYTSEKSKRLTSPALYWVFSLMGSYLMFVYGWCRNDFSIIFGQLISYYVYLWNLNAKGIWRKMAAGLKTVLLATPLVAACLVMNNASGFFSNFLHNDKIPVWLVVFGSAGQLIFTLRFVYQIIYSMKRGESALPLTFWIISLVGSGTIIAYAIIRKDIVLLLGQGFGFLAYLRNIMIGLSGKQE